MRKIDSRWVWIGLGVLTLILRIILGNYPAIIEQFYSRGFFLFVRKVFDFTIGIFPIPFIYILLILLLVYVFRRIFRKRENNATIGKRILSFLFSLAAFLFGVIFLFLILWGFNYGRIPIEQQIGIDARPLNKEEVLEEYKIATEELLESYEKVKDFDSLYLNRYVFESDLEIFSREGVKHIFDTLGYPSSGKARVRYLYPEGSLLRISTAGFYLPFTGECHVDPGLHPLQIPYVMSHELAHGFGIGDEGTCNFIAYLTCKNSNEPIMKYSGLFSYWRSVASQYRRHDPEHYKELRKEIPQGILAHLKDINRQMDKFPDLFPAVRDATYDAYLKTQGVKEGLQSYSRVLLLVRAHRKKEMGKEI